MPSLLVFTPTYDDAMRPETGASISAQKTDVAFVWEVGRHNPYGNLDVRNVVAQYQRAWQMALDGGFDALLTVEHDMVLPEDAIEKLYKTDAPVVYGVYLLRHGTHTLNTWQYTGGKNMGMSLSLYPAELKKYLGQGWGEVSGTGWGCTLIRREVLERTTVRQSGDKDAGDIAFSTDCVRARIRQIARFDVPCLHIEPDGNVLHPFEREGGIVRRVYAVQNVTCKSDGQTVVMKTGRYYTIEPGVAEDLARAGYVRITNDDEKVLEDIQPQLGPTETAVDVKAKKRSKRALS